MPKDYLRIVLSVERLEDLWLPAGIPWPVDLAAVTGILNTYGQFQGSERGGIHFHEGIDIQVPDGTVVRAIDSGYVEGVRDTDVDFQDFVSIARTSGEGWNYIHIQPDRQLLLDYYNARGAGKKLFVTANRVLGTVAEWAVKPDWSHLHLDAAGARNPSGLGELGLLTPRFDPLSILSPLGDTTSPTLGDVHFMRGEDDNSHPHALQGGVMSNKGRLLQQTEPVRIVDHGYFKALDPASTTPTVIVGHLAGATANGAAVGGSSNIDILANATDVVKGNGPPVGVRSIDVQAAGKLVGKTIPLYRPINFEFDIVDDPDRPNTEQTYDALKISDLTRIAYQNDQDSPSNTDPATTVRYFHFLTNFDGTSQPIKSEDRPRYWRSKVTQGAAWNDINSTEAVNNAKGAFPDDYYTFTITAKDAAGNATPKISKVLLDNWPQQIIVEPVIGVSDTFTVRGTNWTADKAVPFYLLKGFYTGADGKDVVFSPGSNVDDFVVTRFPDLMTNADGVIPLTQFVVSEWPYPNYPPLLFADYHGGDKIYQPQLDATTEVQLAQTRPRMSNSDRSPTARTSLSPQTGLVMIAPPLAQSLHGGRVSVPADEVRRPASATLRQTAILEPVPIGPQAEVPPRTAALYDVFPNDLLAEGLLD